MKNRIVSATRTQMPFWTDIKSVVLGTDKMVDKILAKSNILRAKVFRKWTKKPE